MIATCVSYGQNQTTCDKLISVVSQTVKTTSFKESFTAYRPENIVSQSGTSATVQLNNAKLNGVAPTFPVKIDKTLKNGYVVAKSSIEMSVTQNGKSREKLVQHFHSDNKIPVIEMAFNGKDSIQVSYNKEESKPPFIMVEKGKPFNVDSYSPIDYVSKYNTWTREILEDESAFKRIEGNAYFSKESSETVTFSEDGNQILKIEGINPGESEEVILFSDFVDFEGVKLPTKYSKKYVDEHGTPKEHFEISRIKYSLESDDVINAKYEELTALRSRQSTKK